MYDFNFNNLIAGILVTVFGFYSLKHNYQMVGITGRQEWIERYLGSGSTYLAYKILSILMIAGGILFATGLLDNALGPVFSPILEQIFPSQ